MAEEGADPHANAAEERAQIQLLQSEQFRKQEQLERLKQRSNALDEELQQRETELQAIKLKLEHEQQTSKRAASEDKARTASAEDSFMNQQVSRMLQDRVPIMAALEDDDDHDLVEKEATPKQGDAGTQEKEKVHDTVLVSYLQNHEGRQDDFKVSYRIDSNTTVEQLHRDACAYWGCSRKVYQLWKVNQLTNEIKCLSEDMETKLQDPSVLSTSEQAHLHLCHQVRDVEEVRRARMRERERERKQQLEPQVQVPTAFDERKRKPHDVLVSLRHGFGFPTDEKQPEEFVEAFKPWPGFYRTLRERDRVRKQRWRETRFSDFIGFTWLIIFSATAFGLRNHSDFYLLRAGVARALNEGSPSESSWVESRGFLLEGWPEVPWSHLSPGANWSEDGTLRFDGPQQAVRAFWPLPNSALSLELTADFRPSVSCAEYTALLGAAGADVFMLRAAWNCSLVQLAVVLATNGSNSSTDFVDSNETNGTTSDCTLLSNETYALSLKLSLDGSARFLAGRCELELPAVSWGLLGTAPVYLTLGADGDDGYGGFENLWLTVSEPAEAQSFKDIRLHRQIKQWLGGSFHYQVFDKRSTLRQHYTPVGYLRFRQQRAKSRPCDREVEEDGLALRSCYHVLALSDTQHQDELTSNDQVITQALANLSAAPAKGAPAKWGVAPEESREWSGSMQAYTGGGYWLDLPLENAADLAISGKRLQELLDPICNIWLNRASRLLVLELVLENADLNTHATARMFLEMAPSGAVNPVLEVLPMLLSPSYEEGAADALDVVRWILIICFLLLFHSYMEIRSHVEQGRSWLAYVLSAGGLLDLVIAILFFVVQGIRFRGPPGDPRKLESFKSYSQFAYFFDQLNILEALLLWLLLMRMATFMGFFPPIFRFFQTFVKSLQMFAYYCMILLPVFWGILFLSSSIYSQHLSQFKNWNDGTVSIVISLWESLDVEQMYDKNGAWTMAFVVYFFLCLVAFLMNGFLAIVVHIYFDTELVDTPDPADEGWGYQQWMEWMLLSWLYKRILGGGGSGDPDEEDGEMEDSEDSDEEETEGKRR